MKVLDGVIGRRRMNPIQPPLPTTPPKRRPNVSVHRVPQLQGVGRAGVLVYVKCPTTQPMRAL